MCRRERSGSFIVGLCCERFMIIAENTSEGEEEVVARRLI